jgi:membrane associated rhomboid family serine protease
MGFQDRDYYREEEPGFSIRGPRTVIGWIILINVTIFAADGLITPFRPELANNYGINDFLALHVGDLAKPWLWWRFLTYGFAHASFGTVPGAHWHILGNMLGLFFLGRSVEQFYGPKEFLRFYLTAIVASGLIWAVATATGCVLAGDPLRGSAVGASGAVVAVVILFALNFPRQTLLLFFVIPVPAWLVGVFVVVGDLLTAMNPESSRIAWQAHLAGAGFAFLYFRGHWNLTRLSQNWFSSSWFKRRPNLRIHDPRSQAPPDDDLADQVDKILEKIHLKGEDSLTSKERRMLKNASRKYQEKRRDPDD